MLRFFTEATHVLRKLRMFYTHATYVLQPNQHVLATNALHIFRTEIAHGINSHSSNIMGFICYSKSANEHHYCTEVHPYIFWWRKPLTKSQNLWPGVIREGLAIFFRSISSGGGEVAGFFFTSDQGGWNIFYPWSGGSWIFFNHWSGGLVIFPHISWTLLDKFQTGGKILAKIWHFEFLGNKGAEIHFFA